MTKLLPILTVAVLALAGACGYSAPVAAPPSAAPSAVSPTPRSLLDPHGNVFLYVSNESGSAPRVDITVTIDGRRVVGRTFVKSFPDYPKPLRLWLAPGRHVLTAASVAGAARLSRAFSVNGRRWLSIMYTFELGSSGSPEPRQLLFRAQSHPMLFD
jgi:hypothetical protein